MRPEAPRCTYEWSVIPNVGAPYVLHFRRCANRTRDASGRCGIHRDHSSRFDKRLR